MRHFGFGIGHVNPMVCQRNNEDDAFGSDLDSQSESDAIDLMPDSRASDLENVDISMIANDDLDQDSDSEWYCESSLSTTNTSSSSSDSSGSDTRSDDDGYASF